MPQHAVATPQRDATEAAVRAFAAGGNAVDAALAAAAVLTVTYPHMCALGGDVLALVREPGGRTVSVNASGPAGSAVDVAALRARGAMPVTGVDTVTVPGLVAGWERIHALAARLPWAAAIEPAIALAHDGVAVAPRVAEAIAESEAVTTDPGMAAVFGRLRAGDVLRQPALAATLRAIAEAGARAFYEGDVAERIAAAVPAITVDDLRGFEPEATEPLRAAFGDLGVLTSPPNSSGVLLLQALVALERIEYPLGDGAGELAAILRAGAAQRDRMLGDPRASRFHLEDWLHQAPAPAERVHAQARPGGDTIAVVAADADGRAVSLIQSVFHSFGAGILEPATGVLLHNRGASFALEPGHPNALAPGRRPAHTLIPVLVERGGRLAGALGTMGGRVQAQINLQVLLRLLAGATPQQAVDAPRWVAGGVDAGEPDEIVRVEDGCDERVRAAFARAGLRERREQRRSDWLGHAMAVWLRDGELAAGSDFRADGAAAVA